MKKIGALIIVAVVIITGIIFVPRLVHRCDSCDEVFVGTGYEPNVVTEILDTKQEIICEECAEKQHLIGTAIGKDLDEYKLPLF